MSLLLNNTESFGSESESESGVYGVYRVLDHRGYRQSRPNSHNIVTKALLIVLLYFSIKKCSEDFFRAFAIIRKLSQVRTNYIWFYTASKMWIQRFAVRVRILFQEKWWPFLTGQFHEDISVQLTHFYDIATTFASIQHKSIRCCSTFLPSGPRRPGIIRGFNLKFVVSYPILKTVIIEWETL